MRVLAGKIWMLHVFDILKQRSLTATGLKNTALKMTWGKDVSFSTFLPESMFNCSEQDL
jgi:hypothetical protein